MDNASTDQIFVRPQLPRPFSPWAGDWSGTTNQSSYPLSFHVNDEGAIDQFTVKQKLKFPGFTCTGNASRSTAAPLLDDLIRVTVIFPLSTVSTTFSGTFNGLTGASGAFTGSSGGYLIICGSTLSFGTTGTILAPGTWSATKQ